MIVSFISVNVLLTAVALLVRESGDLRCLRTD